MLRYNNAPSFWRMPESMYHQVLQQLWIEVLPLRIVLLDQPDLPCALPVLDCHGGHHVLMQLIPSQCMHMIFTGKSSNCIALVFPDALDEVRGNAINLGDYVQSSAGSSGEPVV